MLNRALGLTTLLRRSAACPRNLVILQRSSGSCGQAAGRRKERALGCRQDMSPRPQGCSVRDVYELL
jgi:hypothetical protein